MGAPAEAMRALFTRVAGRYDAANAALTFGMDALWRRAGLKMLAEEAGGGVRKILDIACGTGDVAAAAAGRFGGAEITGLDLTPAMLDVARSKCAKAGLAGRVRLVEGEAGRLPFGDGEFDAAVCAFGFRNFPDAGEALGEAARVLRPGGRLLVLEFWRRGGVLAKATGLWLGAAARVMGADYAYLKKSIGATLSADEFAAEAAARGLREVRREFYAPACSVQILAK